MESWILAGSVHALYMIFALRVDRKRDVPQIVLSLFFFVIFLVYGLAYVSVAYSLPFLSLLLWNVGTLVAPFYLVYTRTLTVPKEKTFVYLPYFIPYIASLVYIICSIVFLNNEELFDLYSETYLWHKPVLYILFQLIEIISPIFFAVVSIYQLKKHEQKIRNEFSYVDTIDLHWFRNFIFIASILFAAFALAYYIFPLISPRLSENRMTIGFVATLPAFFYVSYQGVKQKVIPISAELELSQSSNSDSEYIKTNLTINTRKEFARKLEDTVIRDSLYLLPKLSMEDLQNRVGIPKHNLSEVLNNELHMNFYEYINRLRIQSFQDRIRNGEHKQFTILSIAMDSGFSSKASFNRTFKTFTGSTPSEFVRSVDSAN